MYAEIPKEGTPAFVDWMAAHPDHVSQDMLVRHVLLALWKQGKQALVDISRGPYQTDTVCQYRADYGRRCGAGWCLPDHLYKAEMEGVTIQSLIDDYEANWPSYLVTHQELISKLQRLHDRKSIWQSRAVLAEAFKGFCLGVVGEDLCLPPVD